MFSVTIREKSGQVYTFHFDKPEIMIGRVKGNDVILPKQNISKRHSLVRANTERFIVEDLGSTNGTYVNGHRIASPVEITSDDKVYLGDFVMQFFDLGEQLDASAGDEESVVPAPIPEGLRSPSERGFDAARSGADDGADQPPIPSVDPATVELDSDAEDTVAELDSMAAVARLMAQRSKQAPPVAEPEPAVAAEDPLAALDDLGPRMTGPMDGMSADAGLSDDVAEFPESIEFSIPESDSAAAPAPEPPARDPITMPPARDPIATPPPVVRDPEPEPVQLELSGDHHLAVAALYDAAIDALHTELPHDAALLNDVEWQAMEAKVSAFVDRSVQNDSVPSDLDLARVKHDLIYEIAGLGPLELMLDDSKIESIEVNGPAQVHVVRDGQRQAAESRFSGQPALLAAVERLVRATGANVAEGATHADGTLADGTSVRVVWPPLCPNGPVVLLRKPRAQAPSIEELIERGALTQNAAELLQSAVAHGRSVAICGPHGVGRRTLVNALALGAEPARRIVVAEAGLRIVLPQTNVVRIDISVTSNSGSALQIASALRPDLLLLCTDESAHLADFIAAAANGLPPWVGSFYAHDAADLLRRTEQCIALTHPGVASDVARSCAATTFDVVASFSQSADGGAVLDTVIEVLAEDGTATLRPATD